MADNHWRNTMRPARFFVLDARAAFPFLLCLLNAAALYMWIGALILTMIFWIVEKRGYTFDAALRWARAFMVAPKRPAIARNALHPSMDYAEKSWLDDENLAKAAKPAKSAKAPAPKAAAKKQSSTMKLKQR